MRRARRRRRRRRRARRTRRSPSARGERPVRRGCRRSAASPSRGPGRPPGREAPKALPGAWQNLGKAGLTPCPLSPEASSQLARGSEPAEFDVGVRALAFASFQHRAESQQP